MGKTTRDPVDHARTNCQFTGEAMQDGRIASGLLPCALGVLALAGGIYLLAVGTVGSAALLAGIAVIAGGLGAACVLIEHHRVLVRYRQWVADHRAPCRD